MSLIKRENGGLKPFRSLLTDFFEGENLMFNTPWNREGVPAVNVSETDRTYEIELAAPGLKKSDFKVKVENGVLTISAERKEEREEKGKNYTRQEYNYTSFTRAFTLPENVKQEDIKAHYEDGVLQLTLAKTSVSVSKAKEIQIV